jgi:hypothetical protein
LGEELLTLGLQTASIQPGQGLTGGNGIPFIYQDGDDGTTGLKAQAAAASGDNFTNVLALYGVAPYGLEPLPPPRAGEVLLPPFPRIGST